MKHYTSLEGSFDDPKGREPLEFWRAAYGSMATVKPASKEYALEHKTSIEVIPNDTFDPRLVPIDKSIIKVI